MEESGYPLKGVVVLLGFTRMRRRLYATLRLLMVFRWTPFGEMMPWMQSYGI